LPLARPEEKRRRNESGADAFFLQPRRL